MKKVLILSRKDNRPSFDQVDAYRAGLDAIDTQCEYTIDEFENLLFDFDGTELHVFLKDGETDIATFDAVFLAGWFKLKILEDIALSVATYLVARNVRVVNSEAAYTRSRSKLSQYVTASQNGIKITPFLFSLNLDSLREAISKNWKEGYPVIMKGVMANHGNDNHLVKSKEQALEIINSADQLEGPWYVLQSFVPNDGDYRIIVMGDKVTTVIHRKSQSESHLNNTTQGGKATIYTADEIPASVVADSVKLAKLMRREVTGIDMIQHQETGEFYLLEINNMPQLATGSYVADKLTQLDNYLAG